MVNAGYFALVFINSGILWNLPDTVMFPYAQEGFLALLTVYAGLVRLPAWATRGRIAPAELGIVILVLVLILWPAVTASLYWGQPLMYGVAEERRALSYLIFFPLFIGLIRRHFTTEDLMRWVAITAAACFFVSLYFYLTQFSNPTFNVDEMRLRGDRVRVGVQYVLLTYFFALHMCMQGRRVGLWLTILLLCVIDLVVFMQTRQLIAGVVVATLPLVLRQPGRFSIGLVIVAAVVPLVMVVNPEYVAYLVGKYQLLFGASTENALDEVRGKTISQALDLFAESGGVGGGSLSLLWRDGFHRMFGGNFFLSDVGVIGSLVRFGVFAFLIHGVFWVALFRMAYHKGLEGTAVITGRSYLLMAVTISLLNPMLEYSGYTLGMVIAVFAATKHLRLADIRVKERAA